MSIVDHGPSSAARAALTAASTSSLPASDTMPTTLPSTGERSSKVLPDLEATNSPLMKFRILFSAMVASGLRLLSGFLRGGFALRLALRDIGQQFGAAIGGGQSPEQERETDDRLHLLPGRAGTTRSNSMQRCGIVHVHQEHAEQHELRGLHVEALGIHRVRSHALLHVEELRIESTGDIDAGLDARRHEPDQFFVDR